jgi:hypothetical protein
MKPLDDPPVYKDFGEEERSTVCLGPTSREMNFAQKRILFSTALKATCWIELAG